METVYVVLAFYSDGSSQGAETVLCAFSDKDRAERFVALAKETQPSKSLEIAAVPLEK